MKVLEDVKNKDKSKDKDKEPKPKSTTDSETLNRRRRLVKETIDDFAAFAATVKGEDDSDPGNLSTIIRNNAEDLAFGIAAIAEKMTPLGIIIDRVCGRGGILSIARSFSSVAKWVVFRVRETRSQKNSGYLGTLSDGRAVWRDSEGFAAIEDETSATGFLRLEQGAVFHQPNGETVVV